MKQLIALAAAALLAVSVQAAPSSPPAEPLKVAYNQWAGFAPVFLAVDKGYFEAEGIAVQMVSFPGPADSVPPLLAGHIDVALTTPDAIIPINAPAVQAVTVMVLDASHGGDGIVAKAGIGSVAELKGKRVAATEGEVNHMLLALALESAGLTTKDVQLTNMNADDAGAAFIAGRLDAAVTWEPWLSNARDQAKARVLFTSADAPGMLIDVAAVTPATLASRGEELAAFARALDRALVELKQNPEASHALVGKWLGMAGSDVAGMLEGIRLYGAADNRQQFRSETGLAAAFGRIQQFLASQGRLPAGTTTEEMVDGRLFAH